jgi:hypothetical protein
MHKNMLRQILRNKSIEHVNAQKHAKVNAQEKTAEMSA